ncbi:MAG: VTT domain-containing protein [Cyclobacteriaceae bacterium]
MQGIIGITNFATLNKVKHHIRMYGLLAWMSIVPLVSSASIALAIITNEGVIADFPLLHWVFFYTIATITMALAITPTTFVALVSGYFLGFEGVLAIILSYQTASVLGYYLASQLDDSILQSILDKYPKSKDIIENVNRNQFWLTFLARLSPALPFAIMNVVLSVSKIRLFHFFWGGLVGMLPRTLFFIWVGKQAASLDLAFENTPNLYWSIGLTALILILMYKIVKRPG